MPAAAYWRLNLHGTCRAAEWYLRETAGGVNAAGSATLTSSSVTSGVLANLVDGSSGTDVLLASTPAWVRAQFGAPVTVLEWGVRVPSSAGADMAALQYSDDGANWTDALPALDLRGLAAGTVVLSSTFTPLTVTRQRAGTKAAVPAYSNIQAAAVARANVRAGGVLGNYRVAGDVAIAGSPDMPVRRRTLLLREPDLTVVAETWSVATTGAFEFLNVAAGAYTVLAEDYPHTYNSVVAARVAAVP